MMVNIWLMMMAIIWLMMVNNDLAGGVPTPGFPWLVGLFHNLLGDYK